MVESPSVVRSLQIGDRTYDYYSLPAAEELGLEGISSLPYTLKVALENILRNAGRDTPPAVSGAAIVAWLEHYRSDAEIEFKPVRVLMPDSTGVPFLGDLAAMRDAMMRLGGDPKRINPVIPVDVVVDHSVIVDAFGSVEALRHNATLERLQNDERFAFLHWGGRTFDNLRIIPPGTGICHQINLECLARVVWTEERDGRTLAFPDSLVGMDSHTTMVNGLGVVGWGVGGLEGATAALGEPVSMLIPEVVGCRLSGALRSGVTSTDLVLTITEAMRAEDVVGKVIEYFGPGVDALSLPERATVANMTPEFGATMGFFPVDAETLRYLRATGREAAHVALVEAYSKAQGLWRDAGTPAARYSRVVEIDLASIPPSVSGPSLPHQRVALEDAPTAFAARYPEAAKGPRDRRLASGDVVIAAITSCTNTSNPSLMIAAGLLARNAVRAGLLAKPWVKTSLSPGSRVAARYLTESGLQDPLDTLGFNVVGFGCMTCMGNSGPLPPAVQKAIEEGDLATVAVLSGNRNFEGRIHPSVKANFLASPPLVVAYALAGSIMINLATEPLGTTPDGTPVHLRDIWPTKEEIDEVANAFLSPKLFRETYRAIATGSEDVGAPDSGADTVFPWDPTSTFIRRPPFFERAGLRPPPLRDIRGARILAIFGDIVTTDHISPIGAIPAQAPAGRYLRSLGIEPADFVNYASRRLNHDVMARGAFASPRIRNEMTPDREGGFTRHQPDGDIMPIFDAAERYRSAGIPLVVVTGRNYGAGSSRDWAAKGPRLLGVRAVIAESFERIHRSNLVGMGVLPLQFLDGASRGSLALDGSEVIEITGFEGTLRPLAHVSCTIVRMNGERCTLHLLLRADTANEVEYLRHDGILPYALRRRLGRTAA
jgi:aconitate hydratase